MRQQARRESARAWVGSGAPVSVKAFARRYGVDRYTAYADRLPPPMQWFPRHARWLRQPELCSVYRYQAVFADSAKSMLPTGGAAIRRSLGWIGARWRPGG